MPFKSKAQKRYLFLKEAQTGPEMGEEVWDEEEPAEEGKKDKKEKKGVDKYGRLLRRLYSHTI